MINREEISASIPWMIILILLFNGHYEAHTTLSFNLSNDIAYSIITILILIMLFIEKRIHVDEVGFILFSRVVILGVANLVNFHNFGKISAYLTIVVQFLSYVAFSNSTISKKTYLAIMKTAFLIICIQTLFLGLPDLLRGTYVKVDLIIPIGGSNYIGCIVTLLAIELLLTESNPLFKYIYLILMIITVIVTQSSSSIIMSVAFLLYYLWNGIKNNRNVLRVIIAITAIILIYILFADRIVNTANVLSNTILLRFATVWNRIFSRDVRLIQQASNGRFTLWENSMELVSKKPILGYGSNYSEILGSNSHNLITDALLFGGYINLVSFVFTICYLFYSCSKNIIDSTWKRICLITLAVSLVQGQVEPNFQGFAFSILFFSLLGISSRRNEMDT